mgnify:CR=1 FL=1
MAKRGELKVGTSGYQYDHWKGVFYPDGVKKKEWFTFYAKQFDTVEINNSFYSLPRKETVDDWYEKAPEGFCFVMKFSRYGTHMKKLKEPQGSIDAFMERAERLKEKLGPILVQLPPKWGVDVKRLENFLRAAPKEQRWALEFRDESWLCDDVFEVLEKYEAALCIHDLIDNHPQVITTDWSYLRFHGAEDGGNYPYQALSASAQRAADMLDKGLDLYIYFNNDAHGHAVKNAERIRCYINHAKDKKRK